MPKKANLRQFLRDCLRRAGTVRAAARSLGVTEDELIATLRHLGMISAPPPSLEHWFRAA